MGISVVIIEEYATKDTVFQLLFNFGTTQTMTSRYASPTGQTMTSRFASPTWQVNVPGREHRISCTPSDCERFLPSNSIKLSILVYMCAIERSFTN